MKSRISAIAALAKNRVIGSKGALPWNIPADMRRFRELTTGHTVVMGRRTYESIGHALPNRVNIVISRDTAFVPADAHVVRSLEAAVSLAQDKEKDHDDGEIFIIGGGQIYEAALPIIDRLYLTIVEGEFAGDTYFPPYHEFDKELRKQVYKDGKYTYTFIDLDRSSGKN